MSKWHLGALVLYPRLVSQSNSVRSPPTTTNRTNTSWQNKCIDVTVTFLKSPLIPLIPLIPPSKTQHRGPPCQSNFFPQKIFLKMYKNCMKNSIFFKNGKKCPNFGKICIPPCLTLPPYAPPPVWAIPPGYLPTRGDNLWPPCPRNPVENPGSY